MKLYFIVLALILSQKLIFLKFYFLENTGSAFEIILPLFNPTKSPYKKALFKNYR
ncbi:hypothetical protein E5E75_05855 [Helicobacter pylori]|nr:hypothetical protein E5E75_05855 [Helicobacter pylori]